MDIHDRRPVALSPELAREWLDPATQKERAEQMVLLQGGADRGFRVVSGGPGSWQCTQSRTGAEQAIHLDIVWRRGYVQRLKKERKKCTILLV